MGPIDGRAMKKGRADLPTHNCDLKTPDSYHHYSPGKAGT